MTTIKEACASLRAILQEFEAVVKTLESATPTAATEPTQVNKRKRRVPSEFVQAPVLLDPKLHTFLVESGAHVSPLTEPVSRYDVLKMMCTYVKQQSLQMQTNRKNFGFNQQLCDLFQHHVDPPQVGQECSFLQLGKFVTPLLIKVDEKIAKK